MLGLNKVFIMGNLTRDPELKYTPNGQAVASFGIATNRRWTTPEGEKKDEVEFHNIVAWGRTAETINQYMKKGNPLFIEGRLKTQNWEGPDGVRRNRTEIIVDSFQFIGSGGARSDQNNNQNTTESTGDFSAPAYDSPTPPPRASQSAPGFGAGQGQATGNGPVVSDDPFAAPTGGNKPAGEPVNPDEINIEDIPF